MPEPLRLSGILKELGIRRAFDWRQADFTGIAPTSEQLEVSEGFHKAFIEVDERGTEAAASTAFSTRVGGVPPIAPPRPFVCDHPFAFAIRDHRNDAILFMGRVADPAA
jgi:serpin B